MGGSTTHPYTRLCFPEDEDLHRLARNYDVSDRLFQAGLRLFADSIIAYHGQKERKGQIRYYPPVILTFWSGFETFVRYSSELMLITVPNVPEAAANYLRDLETFIDRKGQVARRTRFQSVLDRYAILLKYGYNFQADRGSKYWQGLKRAKELRDYYTHLDVNDPRSVSTSEVLEFMEAVLLGIIYPSGQLQRTLLLGIYYLYYIWVGLSEVAEQYIEQPFFKDWYLKEERLFHCNFENVDASRFPSMRERLEKKARSG